MYDELLINFENYDLIGICVSFKMIMYVQLYQRLLEWH